MPNSILLENITTEELFAKIRELISEELEAKFKPDIKSDYLTKKETAARLRISLPTLQRMAKSGSVPGYRIGKRILFKSEDVESALKNIDTLKYKRG